MMSALLWEEGMWINLWSLFWLFLQSQSKNNFRLCIKTDCCFLCICLSSVWHDLKKKWQTLGARSSAAVNQCFSCIYRFGHGPHFWTKYCPASSLSLWIQEKRREEKSFRYKGHRGAVFHCPARPPHSRWNQGVLDPKQLAESDCGREK